MLSPKVIDYIDGDATSLEVDVITRLVKDNQLMAYKHEGFWQAMDIRLIKSISSKINVVLTLSPVPLSASPCGNVVADVFLSKATLRLTLDQVTRADPSVHYWPSFECAKWMGSHLPFSFFGDDGQSRHVSRWVVDYIIGSFAETAFSKAV